MKHLIKKLLRESLLNESYNPFKDTTGIPDYEQLKNGNYDDLPTKYDNMEAWVEYMSPEQYIKRCAKQQDTTYEQQLNFINKNRVEQLKHLIEDGTKLYMPYLNNVKGEVSQEGRHRAKAAMDMNIEKIPVLIINSIENSESNGMLSSMIGIWDDLSKDKHGHYYVSYDLSGGWEMRDLLLTACNKSYDDYFLDYLLSKIIYPNLYPNLLTMINKDNISIYGFRIDEVFNFYHYFGDIFPDKYADLFNAYYRLQFDLETEGLDAENDEEQKQIKEEISKLKRPLEKLILLYILTHNYYELYEIISYDPNTKITKLKIYDDISLYDNYESGKDMLSNMKIYDDVDFISYDDRNLYEKMDSKFIEKYIDLV